MRKINKPIILFLTLHTFSSTGGIEKICRALGKALGDFLSAGMIEDFDLMSMYDTVADEKYVPSSNFRGFTGKRIAFTIYSLLKGIKADTVILSHINLLLIALLVKKVRSKTKVVVYAHGIEVWSRLPKWKINFLNKHCQIWAVSKFTASQLVAQQISQQHIKVLNNCLHPYFNPSGTKVKSNSLLNKYQLEDHQPILFTLTRMSSAEKYKGYDLVIKAMKEILQHYPNLKYILAGSADDLEKDRIQAEIKLNGLEKNIILTGYLAENEVDGHYFLADVLVMPSKGEGFGISFIEAAACGVPCIAGNKDGSSDALLNGEFGKLIDPDEQLELERAILSLLTRRNDKNFTATIQQKCLANFGFEKYKEKLQTLLTIG